MHLISYFANRYRYYPAEVFSVVIKSFVGLCFTIIFWYFYGKLINQRLPTMLGYLLITFGMSNVVQVPGLNPYRMGRLLRKAIKDGSINSVLLLPISIIKYFYMKSIGLEVVMICVGAVELLIGMILLKPSLQLFIYWCLAFMIAYMIAFAFNVFEGALAFFTTEASGIKNAIVHISRIFSGKILPLNLFPGVLGSIAYRLPFAYMAYYPSAILAGFHFDIKTYLFYGIFWVIFLNIIMIKLFYRGLRLYEGVGL